MIRAFSVSGGEPRGRSQQRGLPAIRTEVVRFLEAGSDERRTEQILPAQSWPCPYPLPAEVGKPGDSAAEIAFQKPPSVTSTDGCWAQPGGLARPSTCQKQMQKGLKFAAGYLVARC